jgi:hypothetical protein
MPKHDLWRVMGIAEDRRKMARRAAPKVASIRR